MFQNPTTRKTTHRFGSGSPRIRQKAAHRRPLYPDTPSSSAPFFPRIQRRLQTRWGFSTRSSRTITRIAPSPSGFLHVGTARIALFNFLFARQRQGTFALRIEDTDASRSDPVFEKDISEGLKWLGLSYDTFGRQSERTELYHNAISRLLSTGCAYLSKEESTAEPGKTIELVRLKNPGTTITFTDIVRGDISFDTHELGDFVIARGTEHTLYHLAVVVDDHDMGVTHVIRGEDHISNTPRQILICQALGIEPPQYAHIPLILAPDRSRLSKRHGATAVHAFREQGYLPEAMVNYLALLGWSPGTDQELFSLEELTAAFSLDQIQKGGAIFNTEKLDWFNRAYIKKLPQERFMELVRERLPEHITHSDSYDEEKLCRALPHLQERITTLGDVSKLAEEGEIDYYITAPKPRAEQLCGPRGEYDAAAVLRHLTELIRILEPLPEESFHADNIKEAVWDYATEKGRGEVLWPMRMALSGKEKSPDPFALAEVMGREEALARLRRASGILEE